MWGNITQRDTTVLIGDGMKWIWKWVKELLLLVFLS